MSSLLLSAFGVPLLFAGISGAFFLPFLGFHLRDILPGSPKAPSRTITALPGIPAIPGELLVLSLFGVMNRDGGRIEVLGWGKGESATNALTVTNRRFLFYQAPVPDPRRLQEQMASFRFDLARIAEIVRTQGQETVATLTLDQILQENPTTYAIPFTDVEWIDLAAQQFTLTIRDGVARTYLYSDPAQRELFRELFRKFGSRFREQ